MKILVLCDRYPSNLYDGLVLRLLHLSGALAQRHELHLLCLDRGERNGSAERIFRRVDVVPYPASDRPRGVRRLTSALSVDSFALRSPEIGHKVSALLRTEAFDAVLDSGSNLLSSLPATELPPIVADTVDEMVLVHWRSARQGGVLRRLRAIKQAWMMWRFERRYLQRVAVNILAADEDARVARRIAPSVRTVVIPNGVDSAFFSPAASTEDPDLVVFEGSMSFPPNEDAAIFLIREILPIIHASRPSVRCRIVGRDPTTRVRALASSQVEITGTVPDIRPSLSQAAVFVCPMREGGGIKNKILQAWAMGKAVVATRASLGGLACRDGVQLLVRDQAASFAAAVIDLISCPPRRVALGQAGRDLILREYSWAHQASRLELEIERAAATRMRTHAGSALQR